MAYQLRDVDNRLHRIHADTAQEVNGIQNYATSRAMTEAVDAYERALLNRTSHLKNNVNGQLDNLQENIFSRRPSSSDINYEQKLEQYRQLLVHADSGGGSLKSIFS